jgi:uncharacterized MnhB-related membrane protein
VEALNILLLIFILVCAVVVSLTKDLLTSIIIFMAQSTAMSVVWILLRSPDLAITEAAVGAGVTSILMFVALKKLHAIKTRRDKSNEQG